MFGAVRLTGALDLDALRGAFREIVRRHEALRTTFQPGEHGPVQVIAPAPSFDVPLVDLEGLAEDRRRRELARLSGDEARRPFNLARGPLVRAALLRIAAREHTLLVNLHHIISDGWSMGILFHELATPLRRVLPGRAVAAAGAAHPVRGLRGLAARMAVRRAARRGAGLLAAAARRHPGEPGAAVRPSAAGGRILPRRHTSPSRCRSSWRARSPRSPAAAARRSR